MKIKIKKIKRILATTIIVSIMLSTFFTSVNSSSFITISSEKKQKEIDKNIGLKDNEIIQFKKETILKEKNNYNKENSITQFRQVINLIKLIFKDNPEIVFLCQRAQVILQKLPDFICRIIYWFVLYPIIGILSEIWYNHPDLYIQYYAYLALQYLYEAFYYVCDWHPSNLALIHKVATLSELIGSSKEKFCPCMEK